MRTISDDSPEWEKHFKKHMEEIRSKAFDWAAECSEKYGDKHPLRDVLFLVLEQLYIQNAILSAQLEHTYREMLRELSNKSQG